MAEIRVNTTGTLKLFDADDSHSASIAAGTITADATLMTLNTADIDISVPIDVTGASTITTADNTDTLTLVSTDNDTAEGPVLKFNRSVTDVANGDLDAAIKFQGENDAGEAIVYNELQSSLGNVADGSEGGRLTLYQMIAGTARNIMDISQGNVIFNQDSIDGDFRVEGNGNTHALFVRASDDHVGINEDAPDCRFHIKETNDTSFSTANFVNSDNSIMKLENASTTNDAFVNMTFRTGDGMDLFLGGLQDDSDGNNGHFLFARQGSTNLELMRISGDGTIAAYAGHTASNSSLSNVGAILYGSSGQICSKGDGSVLGGSGACMIVNRLDNDGPLVNLLQASTEEGDIAVSGGTVSFNGFTGTHWSRLADNSKPEILKGTIIESIDEMCDWYQAVDSTGTHKLSVVLPEGKNVGDAVTFELEGTEYEGTYHKELDIKHVKSKISDTADSKKVYGLFHCWDGDDEDGINDFIVAQVGTYVIRVNKDVTVEAGDLLVSNGDGTAKKQDDDIIRSKTVAKVNSNVKIETYSDGSYTVPCSLHC